MRIRKSIFTKLMGCLILYAVVLVLTFAACLLLEAMLIVEGEPESLYPFGIIDENGNVADTEVLQKLGGWVEELETEGPERRQDSLSLEQEKIYRVSRVYGVKKTETEYYSFRELLEVTSLFGEADYVGFLVQPENSAKKYLCFYDSSVMQINMTVNLNEMARQGIPRGFLLFFPVSILEIVMISLYLKRKIKTPLDRIIAGMEELRAGGSAGISMKTEAEFEKIVDTFNLMARRLEEEKAERERMTRKKNRMLLELSHDIRTPIATIKSYISALEEGLVPGGRVSSVYHTIDNKAGRVEKLSEDMFVLLKMDNPDYVPHLEPLNLCELLRRLCAEYYDEITGAGLDFEIDIPDEAIEISADPELLSRVAANLLSNAQKYNRTGRAVAVALRRGKGGVLFTVSDDGQEIDAAFAGRMFQPFARGDLSRKTDGGTGLGLAISRTIVEKHGGSIRYRYESGKNVFTVELPISPVLP